MKYINLSLLLLTYYFFINYNIVEEDCIKVADLPSVLDAVLFLILGIEK